MIGIILIVFGEIIQSFTSIFGLYIGTFFMGLGIGLENVLVLQFIKAYFQDKIGFMTGLFSSVISMMSGVGAWLSVKLMTRYAWNWRWALSIWIITTIFPLVIWNIQMKSVWSQEPNSEQKTNDTTIAKLDQRRLFFYMSMQSFVFYYLVAWFPSMVRGTGVSVDVAGQLSFILQVVSVPAGLFFPILAQHPKRSTLLILIVGISLIFGMVFLNLVPSMPILMIGVIWIALGLGGSLSMGITLLNFLAANPEEISALAVKSLSIGYLAASVSPLLIGIIFNKTSSWTLSFYIIIIAVFIMTFNGLRLQKTPVENAH